MDMKKKFPIKDKELAYILKISRPAISKWRKRGRIPAERVLAVERATGISRNILRPDLYPDD